MLNLRHLSLFIKPLVNYVTSQQNLTGKMISLLLQFLIYASETLVKMVESVFKLALTINAFVLMATKELTVTVRIFQSPLSKN